MDYSPKEIVLIAPFDDLYRKASKVVEEEEQYRSSIEVVQADLDEGLAVARKKLSEGTKVVVSRGGTFNLIKNNLDASMVEMKITPEDLVESYPTIMKSHEKLAIIGYGNILSGFDLALKMYPEITRQEITHDSNVEAMIQELYAQGYHTFAGGAIIATTCRKLGYSCFLLKSSTASIRVTLDEALVVLGAIHREQELANQSKNLVDYVHDGVILLAEDETIMSLNAIAQDCLDLSLSDVLRKKAEQVFTFEWEGNQPEGDGSLVFEQLCKLNGVRVTLSRIPVTANGKAYGSVIVFQEVNQIQTLANNIRTSQVKSGFIARHTFSAIIGKSRAITECLNRARKYSAYEAPILVEGDTGVGKELFVQGIHNASSRRNRPFVAVNCATLAPSLVESELFGYEEGSFTGGIKGGKSGMFELANKGTIFFDEVGELPLEMQGRLLRVIQEHEMVRVGGTRVIPLDVHMIFATNRDLKVEVANGKFRSDLYYRINTLLLHIPSLEERREDIPLLANHFLGRFSSQYNKIIEAFTPEAMQELTGYHYAGNVRELRGIIERAVILCDGRTITPSDLVGMETRLAKPAVGRIVEPSMESLEQMEDTYIRYVYEKNDASPVKTCKILGISRATLWRKLKQETVSK
jgi:transcriptional regulator with PAS, ATPase and Fis domain